VPTRLEGDPASLAEGLRRSCEEHLELDGCDQGDPRWERCRPCARWAALPAGPWILRTAAPRSYHRRRRRGRTRPGRSRCPCGMRGARRPSSVPASWRRRPPPRRRRDRARCLRGPRPCTFLAPSPGSGCAASPARRSAPREPGSRVASRPPRRRCRRRSVRSGMPLMMASRGSNCALAGVASRPSIRLLAIAATARALSDRTTVSSFAFRSRHGRGDADIEDEAVAGDPPVRGHPRFPHPEGSDRVANGLPATP
jgi:hypothetical protein